VRQRLDIYEKTRTTLVGHPECIQFRIAATVHRRLNGLAPAYLTELCVPFTAQAIVSGRLKLTVPSVKLSIGSHHSFSASGHDCLRNPPLSVELFERYLKTYVSSLLFHFHSNNGSYSSSNTVQLLVHPLWHSHSLSTTTVFASVSLLV